ncbi:MAG TPA: energy transducer TonB [Caulobacteraceae bacterium]
MSGLAIGRAPRQSRAPALVAAGLLHLGVLALALFAPAHPPKPIGSSVPINIVSSASVTDTRQAVQAPQAQAAQAPQPAPEAKPQPPAPVPAPAPAFTETRPQPVKSQPKPAPTPQPSLKAAQPAAKPFDFNRLQQIIESAKNNAGAQASSAKRGPAKAETDTVARPDAGHGLSQSDLTGLQQLLERLWNPNCDVAGGSAVKLKVRFLVGLDGRLLGRPNDGGLEGSSDPVVAAAARRALDAIREAAPYSAPYYGQPITVNFDAKEACAKR